MRLILGAVALVGGAAVAIIAVSHRGPSPRLADLDAVAPATTLTDGAKSATPQARYHSGGTFGPSSDIVPPSAAAPSASNPTESPARPAHRLAQAAAPSGTPPTSMSRAPTAPLSRNAVLHELQRQLKRVGCYKGRIGDDWTSATRPSMVAFLERVNATLPTAEPDEILLTIVRATPGQVCGSPCPRGQSMSDGRCQPDALLVRNPANEPAVGGITSLPAPAIVSSPAMPGTGSSISPTDTSDPAADAPSDSRPRRVWNHPRTPNVANVRPGNENWVSRAFGSSN